MRNAVKFGVSVTAVVVTIVGCVFGARALLEEVRPEQRQVCAEFTDTVGLYEGNIVTMLGVEVGTVTAIEPLGDRMRVTMNVDRSAQLPTDAEVVTMSSSIVTDRHVEFVKPYTGGPTLGDECIPVERTRTPIGISEALDGIGKLSEDLIGPPGADGSAEPVIGDTLSAADSALQGTAQQWNALIGYLDTLAGNPVARESSYRRLIDNLDTLMSMFVTNWPDMAAVLGNLRNSLQLAEGLSRDLAGVIDLGVDILPILSRNVDKFDDRLYPVLDQLIPAVVEYTRLAGDIGDILMHLPPLAAALPSVEPR